MDGVFMIKLVKFFCILTVIWLLAEVLSLAADKRQLQEDLIRLHVIGNSNTVADQSQKLQVRDAVIEYLQPLTLQLASKEEVMSFLNEHLNEIASVANEALAKAGSFKNAVVLLSKESYDTRIYDTFTLPAGVYDSLRIEIGEAEGKNWWCVVFPSFCIPATTEGFQDLAVSSGFDNRLVNTITRRDGFEIRFFVLDCLGKLENLLFKR